MSNYRDLAVNPRTGQTELANFLDNYYGRHRYAIQFDDGGIYDADKVKRPAERNTEDE